MATILEPKNITAWEDLAKALEGIKGYEFAAEIIKTDYTGNSTLLTVLCMDSS